MPKRIQAFKEKEEKKLTSGELVQVGQFAVRVGQILAGLEAEKKLADLVLDTAEQAHKEQVTAVNTKIELITSDPVKYFKILDTQGDATYSHLKIATSTEGSLENAKSTVTNSNVDNRNLTVEKLNGILNRVNDVYSQGRDIGDMIYRGIDRPNRRDYFR